MGAEAQGGEKLGTGNLSLLDVIAQSIGFIGPVFAAAFFIPTIVGLSGKGESASRVCSVRLAEETSTTSGDSPSPRIALAMATAARLPLPFKGRA